MAMTETSESSGVARHCRWFLCQNEIAPRASGGRPGEYCSLKCQADAKAFRKAVRDGGGGDEALVAFIAASEPLVAELQAHAAALKAQRERVDGVLAAIGGVKDDALAEIALARQAAARGAERAEVAEQAARRMEAERNQAVRDANDARDARDAAKRAQSKAEQLAEQAGREARREVAKAQREVAEHEHHRGRAEATTATAERRRDELNERVNQMVVEARDAGRELEAATKAGAIVEAERDAAKGRVGQLEHDVRALRERLAEVDSERATAVADGTRLAADVERLAGELEAVRRPKARRLVGRVPATSRTRRPSARGGGQAGTRAAGVAKKK